VQYEGFNTAQLQAVNYTTCGSLILNRANETDVIKVLEKPKCDYFYWPAAGTCICPKPCNEMRFDQTITNAEGWPSPARQLSFYNTYIKPHPEIYGNKFDDYGKIEKQSKNMTTDEIMNEIKQIGLIENNFIQLNIQFTQNNKVISNDIPSVTWDTLFATLGGTLNLWMGITILFAAEVMELIFSIISVACFKEKKIDKEDPDDRSNHSVNIGQPMNEKGTRSASVATTCESIELSENIL